MFSSWTKSYLGAAVNATTSYFDSSRTTQAPKNGNGDVDLDERSFEAHPYRGAKTKGDARSSRWSGATLVAPTCPENKTNTTTLVEDEVLDLDIKYLGDGWATGRMDVLMLGDGTCVIREPGLPSVSSSSSSSKQSSIHTPSPNSSSNSASASTSASTSPPTPSLPRSETGASTSTGTTRHRSSTPGGYGGMGHEPDIALEMAMDRSANAGVSVAMDGTPDLEADKERFSRRMRARGRERGFAAWMAEGEDPFVKWGEWTPRREREVESVESAVEHGREMTGRGSASEVESWEVEGTVVVVVGEEGECALRGEIGGEMNADGDVHVDVNLQAGAGGDSASAEPGVSTTYDIARRNHQVDEEPCADAPTGLNVYPDEDDSTSQPTRHQSLAETPSLEQRAQEQAEVQQTEKRKEEVCIARKERGAKRKILRRHLKLLNFGLF